MKQRFFLSDFIKNNNDTIQTTLVSFTSYAIHLFSSAQHVPRGRRVHDGVLQRLQAFLVVVNGGFGGGLIFTAPSLGGSEGDFLSWLILEKFDAKIKNFQ